MDGQKLLLCLGGTWRGVQLIRVCCDLILTAINLVCIRSDVIDRLVSLWESNSTIHTKQYIHHPSVPRATSGAPAPPQLGRPVSENTICPANSLTSVSQCVSQCLPMDVRPQHPAGTLSNEECWGGTDPELCRSKIWMDGWVGKSRPTIAASALYDNND